MQIMGQDPTSPEGDGKNPTAIAAGQNSKPINNSLSLNYAEGEETNWDELFFKAATMGTRHLSLFEAVFQKHSWGTVSKTSGKWVMQLTLFAGYVTVLGEL